MASQDDLDSVYMGTALLHARLSKANRAKVGAVLVTAHGVTLTGFNGTPAGTDNDCEIELYQPAGRKDLVTKPEVIHAELNCILKAAKEGISCVNSTIYVTLSPCISCSAMLIQAGVKKVYYKDLYRDQTGVKYLCNNGVDVIQL